MITRLWSRKVGELLGQFPAVAVINTFLADGLEALGGGYNEKLEYTALTVDRKTEAVIQGLADELGQTVRSGWGAYRERGR